MRLTPSQPAIRVIQEEHDLLSAVIHGMLYLVRDIRNGGHAPDLKIFRAMLFYIAEYPDKVHHPKEDNFLFERLRQRTHELDGTIKQLEEQHHEGDRLLPQLEHALARYEFEGPPAFKEFAELVERYAEFYKSHMRLEESQVLPLATQVFTQEDWNAVNTAFSDNRNPLAGGIHKEEMQKLFSLIANTSPPPIGLGPAS